MKKILNNITKSARYDFSAKGKYAGGELDLPQGTEVNLHIQNDDFIMQANSHTYKISINKIVGLSMKEEKIEVKEAKSPIWRAIIGGILLCWLYPPVGVLVGAIVGAISGIGYSEKTQKNWILRIIFLDKDLNDKELVFNPPYILFGDNINKFLQELSSRIPQDTENNLNDGAIIEL